jgi:FAD/FMN-containing dehydrogenase/Fe-S oxidoreductase
VTDLNTAKLEADLKRRITGEVRFDNGSRALYAADASNYRQIPIGLVIPRTIDDVLATVATTREHGIPLLSRGAGTSIAGQCCNTAIIMDFSKYLNKIIEIDPDSKTARVQPGIVLDTLRNETEKFGLTFGPDPATHKWCTLGGMIGNNSCGVHSVMAGRTVDNVEALDVLLYDGTRLALTNGASAEDGRHHALMAIAEKYADDIRKAFPNIPRLVSGYSIDQLLPENGFNVARSLVGSEGTLVTILEATVNLVPSPKHRVLLVAGYTDIYAAGDHVPLILEHKPIGLEGFDDRFMEAQRLRNLHGRNLSLVPNGGGWIMAEFGAASPQEAEAMAERAAAAMKSAGGVVDHKIYADLKQQRAMWAIRESGLGATSRIPGRKDNWEGWEDAAVAPAKIGPYLRDFRKLLEQYGYTAAIYGHIGDGCLHNRIDWDVKSKEGVEQWVKFTNDAADLVISYGGSLSGEHGDGQARGMLLEKMYGPRIMQAFEDFKNVWDPDWKMNPGKLIRPYRIDENLRYGATYNPLTVQTHFAFPDDDGSFARATERCVGAGACRKEDGVMCPSYMVTREEKHATRGRAHLLFEMLRGDSIVNGWKDDNIKEALDLCLACKGCKGECPVRVDVATYKAEYLSHYYEGRLRPRTAYTMGLIYRAARVASKMPSLVNWLTHSPLTSGIARSIAGIHSKREIPRFAKQTFKNWFFTRTTTSGSRHVILWADTFNNYFRAETAIAATRVLEDAGYTVKVYEQSMCCGRPLYDWGMLKQARKQLEEILSVVDADVSAGIPIVVLEPSCASVFRDELRNLMPEREDARRLSEHVYLLSEFLEKFAPDYARKRSGKALVQLHCHQRAVLSKDSESDCLQRQGVEAEVLDAGCCGMAGAFGFQNEHYDIAMQIGERKLLPRVREAANNETILADGFSCREQIEQATGRKTLHLAELLARDIT